MEWGSVRFFKRLIAGTVLGMIGLAAAAVLVFTAGGIHQQEEITEKAGTLQTLTAKLSEQQLMNISLAAPAQSGGEKDSEISYQTAYPDLYVEAPTEYHKTEYTCYLTFDDGPSQVTAENLDLLLEKNVKATFFVTGANSEKNPELLNRMAAEGHTIGVHSYSHDYKKIYISVDAFLEDFYKMWKTVYDITGVKPTVFRFAGGSVNAYNDGIYQEIVAEMLRRGFTYYDWNVSSQDAASGISKAKVLSNVLEGVSSHTQPIVLMHDRADNTATASALGEMIDAIAAKGYKFAALDNSVLPPAFA